MTSNTTAVRTILVEKKHWYDWIEVIQTAAIAEDIWEYVDPSNKEAPPIPSTPIRPDDTATPLDVADYQRNLKLYDRRKAALAKLRVLIQETVTFSNRIYTRNCPDTRTILVKLHTRFAPTAEFRKREVRKRYIELREGKKKMDFEGTLREWEIVYTDAVAVRLPEIEDRGIERDFLVAVSVQGFTDYWQNRYLGDENDLPDLYELIEKLREFRAENVERSSGVVHGAFLTPTFQGREAGKEKKPCLCGEAHRWSQCPYLVQERRSGPLDPKVEEVVRNKLAASENLRNAVEDVLRLRVERERRVEELPNILPNCA